LGEPSFKRQGDHQGGGGQAAKVLEGPVFKLESPHGQGEMLAGKSRTAEVQGDWTNATVQVQTVVFPGAERGGGKTRLKGRGRVS